MKLSLSADERFLAADLGALHRTLSWAVVGGGFGLHDRVVWHFVRREELDERTDPAKLLASRLTAQGHAQAVGLLTARHLAPFAESVHTSHGVTAHAVATVGLGNALRAGDPVQGPGRVGTINVLCHVSVPLSESALLEALALVVEARTAALLAFDVKSVVSGEQATGTGTDCVVVACPVSDAPEIYAGKHTPVGCAVGASVLHAVKVATAGWLEEQSCIKVALPKEIP